MAHGPALGLRRHRVVGVEVGSADAGPDDAHDRIARLLEDGVGGRLDPHVPGAIDERCSHECRPYRVRRPSNLGPAHRRRHLEAEVGGARCLDRTRLPQFDLPRVEALEEPDAATEEHGDEVDLHLVE